MENEFNKIIEKLNVLRQNNKVEFHPVAEEIITSFEKRWKSILPEDYRRLLLTAGYSSPK